MTIKHPPNPPPPPKPPKPVKPPPPPPPHKKGQQLGLLDQDQGVEDQDQDLGQAQDQSDSELDLENSADSDLSDREAVEGSPENLEAQAHEGRPRLAKDNLRPEDLGEAQVHRRPEGPQTAPEYGPGTRNMSSGVPGPKGSASTGATHDSSGAAAASGKSNG